MKTHAPQKRQKQKVAKEINQQLSDEQEYIDQLTAECCAFEYGFDSFDDWGIK